MYSAGRLFVSLPSAVLDALRAARTGGLRLLGPLDVLERRLSRRSHLPPLWLRRHTGPVGMVESSAAEMTALLETRNLVHPDDVVLDIGCGAGMMAREFARLLGPRGGYVGFDSHPPSIRWCRSRFRGDSRFRFEIAAAGVSPDGPLRFPIESGHAGFILAKSVFTHLTEEDARGCLTEIRRALAPGATALVTAFLFDGAAGSGSSAAYFPFSNAEGSVRWRWRARPRSAIAFDRVMFEGIIQRCGLRVALFRSGFWPGAAEPTGQDILFLVHRDGETRPASRAAPKTP